MSKVYVILQNGEVFEGVSFGAEAEATGELVFTTGMVDYAETLADPCFYGQIVLQTFPLVGNYGMTESDKCFMKGYVVSEWCENPSNFRCKETVDEYLKKQGVPAVSGVDTRRITAILRDSGVMNAKIKSTPPTDADFAELAAYGVTNAVSAAAPKAVTVFSPAEKQIARIALIDCGAENGIKDELCARGCLVTSFPAESDAETILASKPDGIVLSDGPGDPSENGGCIETVKKLLGSKPMLGVSLGHQLMALALGGRTYKLKYGHRGASQPVRDLNSGRVYISSQNHGYAVDGKSLCGKGSESFVNANDGSNEGMSYPDYKAFSVQFNPKIRAENGTDPVFDRFIMLLSGEE